MTPLAARVLARTLRADQGLVPFDAPGNRIMEIANLWREKNPDLGKRLYKAIALTGNIEQAQSDKRTFYVESEKETYIVRVDPAGKNSSCTCPDNQRGNKCKHVLAVGLVYNARGHKLAHE